MLILSLMLCPFVESVYGQEISDHEISNQFMSVVKDVEVEGILSKTAQFNKCREMNKFKSGATQQEKNDALQKATDCFKDEIKKNKSSAEDLKKLADNLQTL